MSRQEGIMGTRAVGAFELPSVAYERSFWSALFTLAGPGRIAFDNGTWRLRAGDELFEVPAGDVRDVRVERGLVWSSLVVETEQRALRFAGLPHSAALRLRGAFLLLGIAEPVTQALASWEGLVARQRYLNRRTWAAWAEQQLATRQRVRDAVIDWLPEKTAADVNRFADLHDRVEQHVEAVNRAHLRRELVSAKAFLDAVEEKPLTRMQREALISQEDHTLVIAGAGTGKTSVVVGKVGYLVKRLGVSPSEILLLAYSRAAAKEMQARVDKRLGVDLKVTTFHALGMGIIGEVEGRKPSLSQLAERTDALPEFIQSVLEGMLVGAASRSLLLGHLVEHLRPCRTPAEFADEHGYISYLKSADIRTLRGEAVRSFEESVIADWLFLNGIDYVYERPYEHDLATPTYSQYRPDFYLPESRVYIEHFGIGRDGSTAPWIDASEYKAGMEWKRAVHVQHGTKLVETYSYERQEGMLVENLAERLAGMGVKPKTRAPEELRAALAPRNVFSVLAKMLAAFLHHFKEGRHTVEALMMSGRGGEVRRRTSFLTLFRRVLDAYKAALEHEQAVDFHDMIGRAADHVIEGRYASSFRYIIVDEFQDISAGRARLLQGLISQALDPRVTCVGDDWQSIYRFAGSDISYMTSFDGYFGYTKSVALDRTFRFGDRLLRLSAGFIQRNPAQLRKQLHATGDEGRAAVVLVEMGPRPRSNREEARRRAIDDIRVVLRDISRERAGGDEASVLLLGRYNFNVPTRNMNVLSREIPGVDVQFMTVHRSKGLQADYVILLSVVSGRYGFPSEAADDPLLDMVLAEPDAMEHAEERRLFYVALTRARRRVYIFSNETQRSPFVEELMQPEYAGLVEVPQRWRDAIPCPHCGGTLTRRASSDTGELFWGCINYPRCSSVLKACAVCEEGAMVPKGGVLRCSDTGCSGQAEICPQCGKGQLVLRTNRRHRTQFWGCSRWRRDGSGCSYTR